MSNIVDLDIIRPAQKLVKLNGKTFDVSYIPTGLTFEVDDIMRELIKIGAMSKEDQEKDENQHLAFNLTIKACVIFVSWKYPEMDEEWFRKNTNAAQTKQFAELIQQALIDSYAGVEAYQKN